MPGSANACTRRLRASTAHAVPVAGGRGGVGLVTGRPVHRQGHGGGHRGAVPLVESVAFRSAEPPLHIHHRKDEAWYILDGKMTFYVGDAVIEAIAGCFAFAPRGIPHTFTVDVEPTRVLVFASPAGFEHFALKLR